MNQDPIDQIFHNVSKKMSQGLSEIIDQWGSDATVSKEQLEQLKLSIDDWLFRNLEEPH